MKKFNTTAVCISSKHYMVDLSERVKEIKKLVDDGKYFTINRARQYGKTTTIFRISARRFLTQKVPLFREWRGSYVIPVIFRVCRSRKWSMVNWRI